MSMTTSRLALLLGLPLLASLAPATADANVRNLVSGTTCLMSYHPDAMGEDAGAPGGKFNPEYHGGVGFYHDREGEDKLISCPVIRSLPISTLGLSDLEVRLSNHNAEPRTVLCTAMATRADGTLISLVNRSVTLPGMSSPYGMGVVDWGDSLLSAGSKGFYGIDCRLPAHVMIHSIYTSENE